MRMRLQNPKKTREYCRYDLIQTMLIETNSVNA